MAPRGRKPKPAALRILEGNPGNRPIHEEPEFSTGELKPPRWLKGAALEEWNRVVPELEELGLARNVSVGALVGLCALYGNAVKASRPGRDFNAMEARQSWDGYRKMCNEFGLTAASATRLGTAKKPKQESNPFKMLG